MQRVILAVVGCVLVVAAVAYGAYRVHRHFFHAAAVPPTEIPSRCTPPPKPIRVTSRPVIAFGDSITNGLGASRRCLALRPTDDIPGLHAAYPADSTYPDDLSRLTHMLILNYGKGGETTADGVPRLRRLLSLLHPRIVLIMEGTNDLLQGKPPGETATNLAKMVADAEKIGTRPVLLTVIPLEPPAHAQTRQFNRLIQRLARLDHTTLVDAGRGLSRTDYNPDGIHPNDEGYRIIARNVAYSGHL
jgi:acyl-CoA thioesterase I